MASITLVQSLDLALRGGLICCALLLASLLWRAQRHSPVARLGALLAAGLAAYAVNTLPALAVVPRPAWQAPLLALGTGNAVVFWLFCRALFDDGCEWQARHGLAWLGVVAVGQWHCFWQVPGGATQAAVGLLLDGLPLVFALLALGEAAATWRGDLVERRRRLRWFIVLGGSGYTGVSLALRLGLAPSPAGAGNTLDIALLFALVAAVAWRVLDVPGIDLFGAGALAQTPAPVAAARFSTASTPHAAAAPASPAAGAPDAAEAALSDALRRLMTVDRVWCEEDLSIGRLALRLQVPEYRLRRLINQRLGHRNFNAFINRWRLDEARRALSDPALARVPVLTIALDAGFQSIGPFNRAFKADTGLTPTEFRRQAPDMRGLGLADS